jgi:hypothetical protein
MKLCPQCAKQVDRVVQVPDSWMNADQFDFLKAGDYYCEMCPSNNRGYGPLCYWWDREVVNAEDVEAVIQGHGGY